MQIHILKFRQSADTYTIQESSVYKKELLKSVTRFSE